MKTYKLYLLLNQLIMIVIAVVVTYNRLDLLKRNIQCLRENEPISTIIVVNNGSTDGTPQWLDSQTDLHVIHQENVGGSGGFYTGIDAAYRLNADWIWCMDDDVFPRPDCLKLLLAVATDPTIGILAPRRLMDGQIFCHDFKGYNLTNPFVSMYKQRLHNEEVNSPVDIAGTAFEGLLWTEGGINSIGVILFNLVDCSTAYLGELVAGLLETSPAWVSGLIVDGVLGGIFGVLSFVPQILLLFLFFSILEDSGYMARVAFILDKIFRKFGLSGRSFMPMIMGFGCSVPAMINTRTLADENEKVATVRVIPFFSCGAKLPILTAIAGGILAVFNVGNADLITYGMYVLGMTTAIVTVLLMRNTTMRGDVPPFIMELPSYHLPQFKSLMIHLWDKLKHYIEKAFTIILASTIVIWFLSHFTWDWKLVEDAEMNLSILASLGKLIQPIFTPLGFGSQLGTFGWVFGVAAITGLIAKENVIATFGTLAACLVSLMSHNPEYLLQFGNIDFAALEDGVKATEAMISATGVTVGGLLAYIAFNMTTIPCFAAVSTARGELTNKKFRNTLIFWLATSYITSTIVYLAFEFTWTLSIIIPLFILTGVCIALFNKYRDSKVTA